MKKVVEDTAIELLRKAAVELPADVLAALKKAYDDEEPSDLGRSQLGSILENIKLAKEWGRPLCQDTGIIAFHATIGNEFGDFAFIPEALTKATQRATRRVPLRPNAVHPLTRGSLGDNTGTGVPIIDYAITSGDYLELTAMPKGAGSENMSALAMLTPIIGIEGIKRFVVETVTAAGAKPCPPIIIGIGIGGKADLAMKLARMAGLRPLDKRHSENELAQLEVELLEMVNSTGIGIMGLGGKHTALGVNIEYAYSHTASLPVGINIGCWANRRAGARIHTDGRVEYL